MYSSFYSFIFQRKRKKATSLLLVKSAARQTLTSAGKGEGKVLKLFAAINIPGGGGISSEDELREKNSSSTNSPW